ncbi:MAG: zinc ribbon domain-containing protein [Acidobacteria bacterium]|nr:zinc ribbon domain-containing protein [Acidobacteriota bacterium]
MTEQERPEASASTTVDRVAAAREKFSCPACGGEARWNPDKQALICPFCGTTSPATLEMRGSETVVLEHDLVAALRGIPDEARGWRAEKTSVKCQSCHAISVFDPDKISRRCDFCGSTALVPYEEVKDAFRPESLLPLQISEPKARDLLRTWYGSQWLAPNAFSKKALTDTLKGVYLPYWTFDAAVDAHWTADSGTYYWVRQGNKQVRQVRWTPASGDVSHVFDDDLVCASLGVDASRMRQIEPFPTTHGLVPYDAGYLSGWTVERYQIDLVAAAQKSRQQMDAALRDLCARQVPGDTHRNLVVNANYRSQTFKHILAPVWLLTYVYGRKSYQVVVNGVTGEIAGSRPWSWIKITLLVLVILAFVAAIYALDR